MRKKTQSQEKWLQKTFRIRPEAVNMYKYLEFYASIHNISKDSLFDIIVNYSLDYITEEKPGIFLKEVEGDRLVKGFTIKKETLDRLNEFVQNKASKKGEQIELLIGIYALGHLNKEKLKELNIYIYVDTFI